MQPTFQSNNPLLINIRQLLLTSKVAKLIEILLVFGVAILFVKLFKSNKVDELLYNQIIIWIANIIMLFVVYLGLKLRGESLSHFGFSFKKFNWKFGFITFLQSILVSVLSIAGFILGSIIMANITGIPEATDMTGYNYLKDNIGMLLLTLGGVYIVSSIGEEVIYRAFLINRISEFGSNSKNGKLAAVIISSIIFGFAHYSWGPMGIVQTGFMGLALGLSYLYLKKKIWVLIFAHAYMDTILMLQMYFN